METLRYLTSPALPSPRKLGFEEMDRAHLSQCGNQESPNPPKTGLIYPSRHPHTAQTDGNGAGEHLELSSWGRVGIGGVGNSLWDQQELQEKERELLQGSASRCHIWASLGRRWILGKTPGKGGNPGRIMDAIPHFSHFGMLGFCAWNGNL